MNLIPPVRAKLAERFIFNFRMPLEALAGYLPAPWLQPQPVAGWGVASFCLLDLRRITVAPLPTWAGLHSLSAALCHSGRVFRYAETSRVCDRAADQFRLGRVVYQFGLFLPSPVCARPYHASSGGNGDRGASARLSSRLFASPAAFAAFIAQGVTSYGLSRYPNRLTRVDLHKKDHGCEPLGALALHSPLLDRWRAAGAVLDSVFFTRGGRYQWSYHGLTEARH